MRFLPAAFVLALLGFFSGTANAAITHVGTTWTPIDNTPLTDSAARPITPVSGMAAGDLVLVEVVLRDIGENILVSSTGGQTWTALTQHSSGSHRTLLFYSIFNGTWTGTPAWATDDMFGSPFSIVMDVYRPSAGATFSLDVPEAFGTQSAVDHSISGQTSTGSSVTVAFWTDADENITWSLQTAGWTNAGAAQLRNTSGTGLSISIAYKIQAAAGATGSVVNRASTSIFAHHQIVTFKETASSTPLSHVGTAWSPADNTPQTDSAARSITPPAGMAAGDLVVVEVALRDIGETISVSSAGGQSWTAGALHTSGSHRTQLFYCTFNGTWASNPAWETNAHFGSPFSLVMTVFRPASGTTLVPDVAEAFSTSSAVDHTISGQTSTAASVTLAVWSDADETIGWTLQTAGWSTAGAPQLRNTSGTGLSLSLAYKIQSAAGATGSVVNRASTSIFAHHQIVTFKQSTGSPPVFTAPSISSVSPAGTASPNTTLRVTHSQVSGAGKYLLRESSTVGGTYTRLTAFDHTGLTVDRTGLPAAGTQRCYQVAAATTDESTVGPWSSPGVCGTTGSVAYKWNPGHYVETYGFEDTENSRTTNSGFFTSLPAPWKGILQFSLLSYYEDNAPGNPATGDGYERAREFMDFYLDAANAAGKHFMVLFDDKMYNDYDPAQLTAGAYYPSYLRTDPIYANPNDPAQNNGYYRLNPKGSGNLSVIARTWTAPVMDRYIAAVEYVCSLYDGRPELEAISWGGVSIGMSQTQLNESGYTYAAYITQVKRWLVAARTACPHTIISIRMDWPAGYEAGLDFWAWARQYKIAQSDYDTTDWPGRSGSVTPGQGEAEGWGKAAFRGAEDIGNNDPDPVNSGVGGTDMRGKVAWIGVVEQPDWDRSPWRYGVNSISEFLDIAAFEGYTHMVWTPYAGTTTSTFSPANTSNIWNNIIKPCIQAGTGCSNLGSALSTSYPTDYP